MTQQRDGNGQSRVDFIAVIRARLVAPLGSVANDVFRQNGPVAESDSARSELRRGRR
jgi:hypothetical protein